MAQIIALVQEKGGAGKSTLLACLSSLLFLDGAKVAIIDTDPQQTISKWAEKPELDIDYLFEDDDSKLVPTIKKIRENYDVIFIDTAGFKSVMTMYAINVADLVLIPSKASEPDAQGALKTYQHVQNVGESSNKEIKSYVIMNDVDKMARITGAVRQAFTMGKVPILNATLWSRTGFKEMFSNGGAPKGTALKASNEIMAELQMKNAIPFYEDK